MKPTQAELARRFRSLHEGPQILLIPNPWDVGSARILTMVGFQALATSSGAAAAVLGLKDGKISREEALRQFGAIAAATELPVSADLGKGYSDDPSAVAETVAQAARVGLVGGSIEDASDDPSRPIYDLHLAIERVSAAVESGRKLGFPFMLTARAENFLRGRPDLGDTIKRLQAYEKAGADVLFAPGLPDLSAVRQVCASVGKPVNFMVGIKGKSFRLSELKQAGVKRVSFGTSFFRHAMTALIGAAEQVMKEDSYTYVDRTITSAEFSRFLSEAPA